MQISHLEELKRYLKETRTPTLFSLSFIMAHDPYLREQALRALLNALPPCDRLGALTLDRLSATRERLAQEINSPSLFSKRCTLIIKEAERLGPGVEELLLPLTARQDLALRLILVGELQKKTPLILAIAERSLLIEFPLPAPWEREGELTRFLMAAAEERGKRLSREAARLLAQGEEHQGPLAQELDKLICYIGEREEITLEDVKALRPTQRGAETIWDLGRSIMQRKIALALSQLIALLREEALPPLLCLHQIRSQLATHYALASMATAGHTPQELARAFPQMKSYLTRNKEMALDYGLPRFKEALELIGVADLRMKSEQTSPDLILELTVARISR